MEEVVGMLASAVVKMAGEKLGSAIAEQGNLLWNFRRDLEGMKTTLETMEAALEDAEKRSIKEKEVLLWLKRLKNAASDISDLLDEFQDTDTQATSKLPRMLSRLPTVHKKVTLASQMKKMREELKIIEDQHSRFGFRAITSAGIDKQLYDQRETTSTLKTEDIVGRDVEKNAIMHLLSASNKEDGTRIVPIYGFAGMGKTTLAGLVFNDTQFKEYDDRVWVYVSQVFNLKKIGTSIFSQLSKEGNQQNPSDMQWIQQRLDVLFSEKKILVVLDDVWEENYHELEKLKRMLHVGKKGSMIDVIATTRMEDIANNFCADKKYKLEPLKVDECWDIIKTYSRFESKANKEKLEKIGLEIAKKCGGVALAAQSLGYILQSRDLMGWSLVNKSDIWNDSSEDENSPQYTVRLSLKLSYNFMPPHLRLCFAYCSIFPKGHNILKDDLIHQWIALDFIKPSSTFSSGQLGEEYMRKLLGISFLQHSKLPSSSWGREQAQCYTMHDLVHDLARSVMRDEVIVFDDATKSNTSEQKYCQYALLTDYVVPKKLSTIVPKKVKALHFLDSAKPDFHAGDFSFAKFLRVLDFSQCSTTELPASVGKLKQLRYLVAPRIQNKLFPDCISKLTKLQYLNLHSSEISAIPESIGMLGCLVRLDLSGCSGITELPESIGMLGCLVRLDLSARFEIREHLGESSCCSSVKWIPEALCGLTKLEYLNLSGCSRLERLPEAIGCLVELQYLNLSDCWRIGELPESFQNLRNLLHLDLSRCRKIEGISGALGGLTTLQHLNLSYSMDGSCLNNLSDVLGNLTELQYLNLHCSLPEDANRYLECICTLTNLEHLDLSFNLNLYFLPESLGNLKRLHTLNLSHCYSLRSLPPSLDVNALKHLLVVRCSDQLIHDILSKKKVIHDMSLSQINLLPVFVVRADDANTCSNLHLLEGVNPAELDIHCLENVRSLEEASRVQLTEKRSILELSFRWTRGDFWNRGIGESGRLLEDKDLLGELEPPSCLKKLEVSGYSSIRFPTWVENIARHLPNLVRIDLRFLPRCSDLPPLGQLPSLQQLSLGWLPSITKIDGDFCGGKGAFRRLSTFILKHMNRLEWCTTYSSGKDGVEEFMFPMLDILVISGCPSMILKPCPPIFGYGQIIRSGVEIISSTHGGNRWTTWGNCWTTLEIENSEMPVVDWGMFQYLRELKSDELQSLRELTSLRILSCRNLTSLPESMRQLASLRVLELSDCHSISALPEWLADLTSLEILKIRRCESIKSLPRCIQQLTMLKVLEIENNIELKQWCQSEENKEKLAHIKEIIYVDCD